MGANNNGAATQVITNVYRLPLLAGNAGAQAIMSRSYPMLWRPFSAWPFHVSEKRAEPFERQLKTLVCSFDWSIAPFSGSVSVSEPRNDG